MKTAFLALLSLCSVSLTMAIPRFNLNCKAYPEICDHHVYANDCAKFGFISPQNGFHRDAFADDSLLAKRRRAVGCGGNTNCGANKQCDEIPYASTYDGGLGCYGVSAGYQGSQSNLYSKGSHHCVDASQNGAHGNALKQFYASNKIGDSQKFYLYGGKDRSNYQRGTLGYKNALAYEKYVAAQSKAAKKAALDEVESNCKAYARTGQQAILTRSARTGVCPDKNTARWANNANSSTVEVEERAPSDNGNAAAITAARADNFGFDRPRQVLTLSSGAKLHGLYGAPEAKLGHKITFHSDEPVDAQGNFRLWNETVVGIQFD